MSDETNSEAVAKKGGLPKFLVFGCLPLFLLCVLTPIGLNMSSRSGVDQKVKDLEASLKDFRSKLKYARTPRFGPTIKGNAVDYYNGIEYVTGMRKSWEATPPKNLPELGGLKPYSEGTSPDYDKASSVLGTLLSAKYRNRTAKNLKAKKYTLTDKHQKVIQAYLPLLKFVDDGLRCDRVEWQADLEQGAAMEIPNLLAARFAAQLMSYRARTLKGSKRVDQALRMVAFGEDHGRGLSLIQKMIGMAIRSMGYRALQEVMETPLGEADYQRIVTFMGTVRKENRREAMMAEYLAMSSTLAHLGGRKVNGVDGMSGLSGEFGDGGLPDYMSRTDLFVNREWNIFNKMNEEYFLPMSEMTGAAYEKKQKEVEEFISGTWSIFAKIAAPNYTELFKQFTEAENEPKVVALLAAVHLHRLKTGKFPEKLDAVAPYFPNGKLPQKTLSEKPGDFRYELKDGQVTISAPEAANLTYRTWLPK